MICPNRGGTDFPGTLSDIAGRYCTPMSGSYTSCGTQALVGTTPYQSRRGNDDLGFGDRVAMPS